MAYSNEYDSNKNNLLLKLKIKFGKAIAKSFPLNSVRVWGLKLCGFKVGKKVYIGSDLIITSPNSSSKSCSLIIEDRVAIAPRVTFVLSSDANWSRIMDYVKPIKGSIKIHHDSWIGTGVIILPNVTIGACSIVAAGSVVTKDVPENVIVAGAPAKVVKKITESNYTK